MIELTRLPWENRSQDGKEEKAMVKLSNLAVAETFFALISCQIGLQNPMSWVKPFLKTKQADFSSLSWTNWYRTTGFLVLMNSDKELRGYGALQERTFIWVMRVWTSAEAVFDTNVRSDSSINLFDEQRIRSNQRSQWENWAYWYLIRSPHLSYRT